MSIDRSSRTINGVIILCIIGVIFTIVAALPNFSVFQLLNIIICGCLAVICYRSFPYQRLIMIICFSLALVYQLVSALTGKIDILNAIFSVIVFVGYGLILGFFIPVYEDGHIALTVGCILVIVGRLISVYNIIMSFISLFNIGSNLGISFSPKYIWIITRSCMAVFAYMIPAIALLNIKKKRLIEME